MRPAIPDVNMVANKVCPVVLRGTGSALEVLAFKHPLAGHQLVKGTVEAGETLAAAALRELAEESGIGAATVAQHMGTWRSGFERQIRAFIRCQPRQILPDTWQHHAPDDGGHTFSFFWHPLNEEPEPDRWHALFREALSFIQRTV